MPLASFCRCYFWLCRRSWWAAHAETDHLVTLYGPSLFFSHPSGASVNHETFAAPTAPSMGELILIVGTGADLTLADCQGLAIFEKLICKFENGIKRLRLILERPAMVEVSLNGVPLVGPTNFDRKLASLTLPIEILSQNDLAIKVRGFPTSFISIEVRGVDLAPPLLSLTTPTANQIIPAWSFQVVGVANEILSSVTAQLNSEPPVTLNINGNQFTGLVSTTSNGEKILTVKALDRAGNEATLSVAVSIRLNHPPVASLTAKSPVSGIAPLIVLFDASASSDPDGDNLSYHYNWGDGTTTDSVNPIVSHEFLDPGNYSVNVVVSDAEFTSTSQDLTIQANQIELPPVPRDVAPSLPPRSQLPLAQAVQFLFDSSEPIQQDVSPEALDDSLISIISGKVADQDGNGLSGVKIKVLGHPAIGYAVSRSDGEFNLAVNGGGRVSLVYSRSGYAEVTRSIVTTSNRSFAAPMVRLTRLDSKVTPLVTGAAQLQIARANSVSDQNGTRTATLVVPKNTSARLLLPGGGTRELVSLNVRMTEFTAGNNGLEKMPAPLPDRTAYTYAIDLTADEATAIGADSVEFSKSVAFYVDNYLNIPTGIAVPQGYLNRTTGYWEAEPDGIVIKVLGIQNGLAQLDLGLGREATPQELSALGIDLDETRAIAGLYNTGASFWRILVSHFSVRDLNFQRLADNEEEEEPPSDPEDDKVDDEVKCTGCEIDLLTRSMGERLDLPGTPYSLKYSTRKSGIRNASAQFKMLLTGERPRTTLRSINVVIGIAGKSEEFHFTAGSNILLDYTWDGLDFAGREWLGLATADITVNYHYQDQYVLSQFDPYTSRTFGTYNRGVSFSTYPAIGEYVVTRNYQVPLRSPFDLATRLAVDEVGRWVFDQHHFFDVENREIYYGHGSVLRLDTLPQTIKPVAGTGTSGFSGDGGPATQARLQSPRSVAVDNQGNIVFTDLSNNRVRRIDRLTGIISTLAGTGVAGSSGDGGLATTATLNGPIDLAIDRDGNVYVSEYYGHVVRKIAPDGIISRVTGTGVAGYSGDGGLATEASINSPVGLVVHPDGSLFVSEDGNDVIRRIEANGIISTIAGTGVSGAGGEGGLATETPFHNPSFTALDVAGNLYVAESGPCRIRRISVTGVVSTVAGTGVCGFNGDYRQARDTQISHINAISVANDGTIYFSDRNNHRVRTIDGGGLVNTIIGSGADGFNGFGRTGPET